MIPTAADLRAQLTMHALSAHFGQPELWLRQLSDLDVLNVNAGDMEAGDYTCIERTFEHLMRRIEGAVRAEPDGRVARTVIVPVPAAYRGLTLVSHLGTVVRRLHHNVLNNPGMLPYKLWPHPAYLRERYDVTTISPALRLRYLRDALLGG